MSCLPFIFRLQWLYLPQSPKNKLFIFLVSCSWTWSLHACHRKSLLGTGWLFFIVWFKFKSTLLFKTTLFWKYNFHVSKALTNTSSCWRIHLYKINHGDYCRHFLSRHVFTALVVCMCFNGNGLRLETVRWKKCTEGFLVRNNLQWFET